MLIGHNFQFHRNFSGSYEVGKKGGGGGNADVSVSPKIRPLLRFFFKEVIMTFKYLYIQKEHS